MRVVQKGSLDGVHELRHGNAKARIVGGPFDPAPVVFAEAAVIDVGPIHLE